MEVDAQIVRLDRIAELTLIAVQAFVGYERHKTVSDAFDSGVACRAAQNRIVERVIRIARHIGGPGHLVHQMQPAAVAAKDEVSGKTAVYVCSADRHSRTIPHGAHKSLPLHGIHEARVLPRLPGQRIAIQLNAYGQQLVRIDIADFTNLQTAHDVAALFS